MKIKFQREKFKRNSLNYCGRGDFDTNSKNKLKKVSSSSQPKSYFRINQIFSHFQKKGLRIDKRLQYKKNGILLSRRFNHSNQYQFIRIATISEPIDIPYSAINNRGRMRIENTINNMRDALNHSTVCTLDEYRNIINKWRNTVPTRFPLVAGKNMQRELNEWKEKKKASEMSIHLDDLIKQGIELIFIVNGTHKGITDVLILLIEYGPIFPEEYDIRSVINRPSLLDLYEPIINYKKLIHLNEAYEIELLKYRKRSHTQSIKLRETVLSQLLSSSCYPDISNPSSSKSRVLKSIGKLSIHPNNCIFSIPLRNTGTRYIEPEIYTRTKYLNLEENKSLIVVSNKADFLTFLQCYVDMRPVDNNHRVLLFSRNNIQGLQDFDIDGLRLDLVSMKSKEEIKKFVVIYMAMDMLLGDSNESGSKDIIWFFRNIIEYDNTVLSRIDTIDEFLDLLSDQLTNQAYLGKTEIISKIYQVIRQYNLRQILNPKLDGYHYIKNITQSVNFRTNHNSSDSYISMFLILFKLAELSIGRGRKMNHITLIIDDPGILRIISMENNHNFFKQYITSLDGLRVIIHSSKNVHNEFAGVPRLELNVRDSKTGKFQSAIYMGISVKLNVNPITWEEILL